MVVNLQGLAGVKAVRSSSAFGFSMINVIFEDDIDYYFARTRVLERLSLVGSTSSRRASRRTSGRRHGAGPDLLVHGRRPRAGPRDAARDPGLVYVRYQLALGARRRRGGDDRRFRAPVPDRRRPQPRCAAYDLTIRDVIEAVQHGPTSTWAERSSRSGIEYIVRGARPDPRRRRRREDRRDRAEGARRSTSRTSAASHARPRVPAGRPRERRRGGRGRCRHHALRRERPRDHPARQGEARGGFDRAFPRGSRSCRSTTAVRPDRARGRHAPARAARGDPARDARPRHVPVALPHRSSSSRCRFRSRS